MGEVSLPKRTHPGSFQTWTKFNCKMKCEDWNFKTKRLTEMRTATQVPAAKKTRKKRVRPMTTNESVTTIRTTIAFTSTAAASNYDMKRDSSLFAKLFDCICVHQTQ